MYADCSVLSEFLNSSVLHWVDHSFFIYVYYRSCFYHMINCGCNWGHVKLSGPDQAGRPEEAESSLFRCSDAQFVTRH